ncbi:hypothetical protein RJ640_000809 [Escallonia rubra]|uniref:Copper transport protein n=1 Tax=Escallonia rubra TaxID=112253 RepID=A0AA88UT31_9ASTE|nr:hypothetical protein RJ640_000809 [Escallonia rubra]
MSPIAVAIRHNYSNTGDGTHPHHKILHTAFYWGTEAEIMFPGWPGKSPGMYALALVFVFTLAVLVEGLSHCTVVKPGSNRVAGGFFQTGIFAVRAGLAYMVMLAVMSYNADTVPLLISTRNSSQFSFISTTEHLYLSSPGLIGWFVDTKSNSPWQNT